MVERLQGKRILPLIVLLVVVLGGFALIAARQYNDAKLGETFARHEINAKNKKHITSEILIDLVRISDLANKAIINKTQDKQQLFIDEIFIVVEQLEHALDVLVNGGVLKLSTQLHWPGSSPQLNEIPYYRADPAVYAVEALLLRTMLDELEQNVVDILEKTVERNRVLSGESSLSIRPIELELRNFIKVLDAFLATMTELVVKQDVGADEELSAIQVRIQRLQQKTRLFSLAWGSMIPLGVLLLIILVYRQILADRLGLEKTIHQLKQAEEALRQVNLQYQTLNQSLEDQVTQRTRQLALSEKQWSDAFEAIQSPLFIHDGEGRILKANRAYLDAAAVHSLAEAEGRHYWELFPKGPGPFFCVDRAGAHGLEIVANARTYQLRFYAVNDESGRLLYSLFLADDVTAQRETMDHLKKFKQIVSTDKDLIAFINRDHTYLAANELYASSFGFRSETIIGMAVGEVVGENYYRARIRPLFERCLRGEEITFETWRELKNIGRRLMDVSFIPYRDIEGKITGLVCRAEDVTEIREAYRQLEFQAHHHPLTGLPNRLLLHERLRESVAQMERNGSKGALLYIDLDNFKHINDSLGHSAGDALLSEVAKRLTQLKRPLDLVAHLSGDEFVYLCNDLAAVDQAVAMAQQILDVLKMPFSYQGTELFLSGSVGISLYPDDSRDVEVLLKNADAALHKAKDLGKNQFYQFAPELTQAVTERIELERYLQRALENNELLLYYQPQFLLEERRVVGCEALIRWNHPQLGLVPPNRFIPLTEETGLIVPIGEWVLRTACTQLVAWRRQGFSIERMAVNLSGRQIQQKNLVEMVQQVLEETGCPAEALELEITEGFIMRHPEQSIQLLQRLRDIGVELSVDDFGTGHSSLSYLKRLPINRLKIDRSFVQDIHIDPDDEEIVKAIIVLGNSLGMKITAEGIETEKQLWYLAEHGCQEGQGFLISRPVPARECEPLLEKN
ncbi:MAG: EAL domain-containing protein [Desulfuromonadaceae bacterium]|nr:EAL domain-containing protein [Desulfuromonadaceae bacterium]